MECSGGEEDEEYWNDLELEARRTVSLPDGASPVAKKRRALSADSLPIMVDLTRSSDEPDDPPGTGAAGAADQVSDFLQDLLMPVINDASQRFVGAVVADDVLSIALAKLLEAEEQEEWLKVAEQELSDAALARKLSAVDGEAPLGRSDSDVARALKQQFEDEELARRLAADEEESSKGVAVTIVDAPAMSQEDADMALARKLMAEEEEAVRRQEQEDLMVAQRLAQEEQQHRHAVTQPLKHMPQHVQPANGSNNATDRNQAARASESAVDKAPSIDDLIAQHIELLGVDDLQDLRRFAKQHQVRFAVVFLHSVSRNRMFVLGVSMLLALGL
jgi:hypothetical protein